MNIRSLLINLSFFAAWIFSMTLVYNQNYAGAGLSSLTQLQNVSSPQIDAQRWFDVSINENKIGYAMNSYSETSLGYVFKDYSLLRLPMAGVTREVLMDFYAVVNDDFSIKAFTFGLTSGEYSTDIFGSVKNSFMELKIQTGKHVSELVISAGEGLYLPGVIPLLLSSKGFPQGEYSIPSLDPISLTVSDIIVAVGAKEKIKVNGKSYEVYRLDISSSGVSSTMWVASNGAIIKEEEAAGMKIVLTSKEKALNIPDTDPEWDILKTLAVSSDKEIENPREAHFMKVELTGIEPAGFNLADDFQRIVSTAPLIMEIDPGGLYQTAETVQDVSALTDFLEPESFIQSDHPRIIRQAKLITDNIQDDSSKAMALVEWVYKNIEKDFEVSLPSAVEVLRIRRGDCNEHSALFTALARAVGIPTKICLGIVYNEGMFYYHAWPAVFINNRWRPVDPTFGQNTADAAHIKLLEGGYDSQASLMRVVGKLKVKIIDVSTIISIAVTDD